jgi:hypothetical protein
VAVAVADVDAPTSGELVDLAVPSVLEPGAEPDVPAVAEPPQECVERAAERGYVERARGSGDARRSVLRLTESGRELIEAARGWQQETFTRLTASWEIEDRARFA